MCVGVYTFILAKGVKSAQLSESSTPHSCGVPSIKLEGYEHDSMQGSRELPKVTSEKAKHEGCICSRLACDLSWW